MLSHSLRRQGVVPLLHLHKLMWLLLILPLGVSAICVDSGIHYQEGDRWLRNGNFLVVCENSTPKVLQCVSDFGATIEEGKTVVENGIEYTCAEEEKELEGSGQEIEQNVNSCSEFADDRDDIFVGNLVICCISRRFKGCVDDNGNHLKTGYFTVENGLLKYCNVMQNQLKARVEPKGCFNGTRDDDVNDARFHVKKYTVWTVGDREYRCGDNGIALHRCIVDGKPVYTGTAWIEPSGRVRECR